MKLKTDLDNIESAKRKKNKKRAYTYTLKEKKTVVF